jgi:AraC family transcriptional regulator of arabinose operon
MVAAALMGSKLTPTKQPPVAVQRHGSREHWHSTAELPRHWIVLPRAVQAAALKEPLLKQLMPSHVGFFPHAAQHRVHRPEGVAQTIFKYCVTGRGWCELGGLRFEVNPGDLLVVPRGMAHAYGADARHPWTIHWFHAIGEHVELVLLELGVSAQHPVIHLGNDAQLVGLFEELREVLEDDYVPARLLYASQLLSHLLGLMIWMTRQRVREAPDAQERIQLSIAYMKEQLDKPLDVETLAAMAGVSASHYSALFRRLTGYSPINYLTRLRIHRATCMLDETNRSIKSIAHALGYEDPLYFSKTFRLIKGICPSDYRRARKQSAVGDSADHPYQS